MSTDTPDRAALLSSLCELEAWLRDGNGYMEHPDGQLGTDQGADAVADAVAALRAPTAERGVPVPSEAALGELWRCAVNAVPHLVGVPVATQTPRQAAEELAAAIRAVDFPNGGEESE